MAVQLYGRLTAAVNDRLMWRYPYVLPLKSPRIPISILRGPTRPDGRLGTLLIAGDERAIEYLSSRFFVGDYRRERIAASPPWKLNRVLKRLQPSVDLTIGRLDRVSARLLCGRDYLAVPEWISSSLTLPERMDDLTQGSYELRAEMQRIRRGNWTYEISHSTEDFASFYHSMYIPFTRNRFGTDGDVAGFYPLRRIFCQGGVLWLKHAGQIIAGNLFQRRRGVIRSVVFGTVNGVLEPVKAGAFAAMYLFLIKHAEETGYRCVYFGGSRPCLRDGVLRYKRRWGGTLVQPYYSYHDFLVRWTRFNKPVAFYFSHTPLIFRSQTGFSALYVVGSKKQVTQLEVNKLHRSMWMPGLSKLLLVSTSGYRQGVNSPPQTTLVDGKNAEDLTTGSIV